MNVLYLLKTLNTTKLSEFVHVIDLPPIDFNLAVWEAVNKGDIEIDEEKDKIKALREAEDTWHDPALAKKIMGVVQHYVAEEKNVTRGMLNSYMRDPASGAAYPYHEYLMTLQYLIDTKEIVEEIVSVPKTKTRPYHKFVFLCLAGYPNEEWNARVINKWIAEWKPNKVK